MAKRILKEENEEALFGGKIRKNYTFDSDTMEDIHYIQEHFGISTETETLRAVVGATRDLLERGEFSLTRSYRLERLPLSD